MSSTATMQNRISLDQLYNVIQLGYHLQDFLKELTIFPDLCCIVAVDDILNDFNKALIVKAGQYCCFQYVEERTVKSYGSPHVVDLFDYHAVVVS
jgi:hypothetical protein